MALKRMLLASVFAVAAVGGAQAAERPEGWYVGLGAGVVYPEEIDWRNPLLPAINNPFELSWDDPHIGVSGTAGYDFNPWRLELESAYRWGDADTLTSGGFNVVPFDGDVSVFSLLANVLVDLPVADSTDIYLGGGLGVARVALDLTGVGPLIDDRDWVLAYQGIAGVTYVLNPHWELFADYRYFATERTELAWTARLPITIEPNYEAHNAFVGVRYFFGAAPEMAPAPEPAPAPAPVEVREFVVYFDFDKANLTAEAQAVVAEAAAAIQGGQNVSVTVVGHTDTVGSAAYNQRLSERRANAVKKELVRLGVGEGAISTSGVGFSQPAVDTGPGVREPRNRRATINF